MAVAIQELRKLQVAIEATKGTLVPATKVLIGEWDWSEEQEKYFSEYPRGVRATTGGDGTTLRKGTILNYESELSPEEILPFLEAGILGGQTSVETDTTGELWTYTPQLGGAPTIKTLTFEVIESDGSTNHVAREFGYAMTETFKIALAFNQIAKFNAKMFGRAMQASTPTGSLAPYVGREAFSSNGTSVFVDTTAWADLGTTQLLGTMRSIDVDYMTGFGAKYNLDGRADLDMTEHRYGKVAANISAVMDLEAQSAAVWQNYRDGDRLYIRIKTEGSLLTLENKYIQQDLSVRLTSTPSVGTDGSIRTVSFSGEAVYDDTAAKIYELSVLNALSAAA